MLFRIHHRTRYRYSCPVSLGPHRLHVIPRDDARQRLRTWQVDVRPLPLRLWETEDDWGNRLHLAEFAGETDALEVDVWMEVNTLPGLPCPGNAPAPLPPDYGDALAALAPCLVPLEAPQPMADFVAPLTVHWDGRLPSLLAALNARIHGFYHAGVRLDGPPRQPADTITRGEGVCRDLALLFMAACRHWGIAARFASGYQAEPAAGHGGPRWLHAWAEACLPDLGWLGYDPTHDSAVGEHHVTVARAGDPRAVTPVDGSFTFRGERVTSTLDTEVRIATE